MAAHSRSDAAVAARVWRLMFDLLMQSAPQRTRSLSRRGLTPNDSRALHALDVQPGLPMRSLAEAWECDPSNATWIVDRLEALGLAERQASPADRRVKLVKLTAKGQRTKAELLKEFYKPPEELAALSSQELDVLERILSKLGAGG